MRGIHWFRHDLRLRDNTALAALAGLVSQWAPVYVIDPRIAGGSKNRARFLHDCLVRLARDLEQRGHPLIVRTGEPEKEIPRLLHETGATHVSFGASTTPFGTRRDAAVTRAIERSGGQVIVRNDHVIRRAADIRTGTGGGYSVYTPYKKSWWRRFDEDPALPVRMPRLPAPIPGVAQEPIPEPPTGGVDTPTGGEAAASRRLAAFLDGPVRRYATDRDVPAVDGTSRLSPYLRFGVISPRQCFAAGLEAAAADPAAGAGVRKWLDELIWREFYAALLEEHPRVLRENHRSEYDALAWVEDPEGFAAWCEGRTGYPIVDAGMRQLVTTGWMHNRVRMIVASFLTKDLGIDWRLGQQFFFEHLVDGDPASNNGNWQWGASTGTDAQPWFRIFHPTLQARRFDPGGHYIRRHVPELASVGDRHVHEPSLADRPPADYPAPIVDHAAARTSTLARFERVRQQAKERS